MRVRFVLPCIAFAFVACSDSGPEAIDPSAVNLADDWILSDIHRPVGGTTSGGITNECHIDNVPVAITATDTPGLFRAEMLEGGTQQCEINGEEQPPESPPLLVFFVEQQGLNVIWHQLNNEPYYIGTLSDGDRMSGTIDQEGGGKEGTWTANRVAAAN